MSKKMIMKMKMMGGYHDAATYATELYGTNPHSNGLDHGIAFNKGVAMSGGGVTEFKEAVDKFIKDKSKENFENAQQEYNKLDRTDQKDHKALMQSIKETVMGGKKSTMNFMMMPKMFIRMTRSRRHRRSTKRHHGKSRKHRKH
jgi:hypothetical protein